MDLSEFKLEFLVRIFSRSFTKCKIQLPLVYVHNPLLNGFEPEKQGCSTILSYTACLVVVLELLPLQLVSSSFHTAESYSVQPPPNQGASNSRRTCTHKYQPKSFSSEPSQAYNFQ